MFSRYLLFFLIIWTPFSLQANQQNPLLTNSSIILSHQGIYKFDRETLQPVWKNLAGLQTYEPVMGDGLLYVGSTDGLFALDPQNGEIVWRIEVGKTIYSPVVSKRIYAGSAHGELYAIDAENGQVQWRQQFDGWVYSPVIQAKSGQLWTGGQAHEAFLLDLHNGKLLARISLGQESVYRPNRLDEQHVIYNLFDGSSVIIDTRSLTRSGILNGHSQPGNLAIDGGTIFRSNRDGSLTAFDKLSFAVIWENRLVSSDLSMHPSASGFLLLSDLDRELILIDSISRNIVFSTRIEENWFAPLQIDERHIVYFVKNAMQPNRIRAVTITTGNT